MTGSNGEERSPHPAAELEDRVDLEQSSLYINRHLSWLEFNRRVLEEALDEENPLLERVKFAAIFGNNLDEFFMIRVAGLRRQLQAGAVEAPPDGMTPAQQLAAIREALLPMLETIAACWERDLHPKLRDHELNVVDFDELEREQRRRLRRYFQREILPVLTPLAFDSGHPFKHISGLSIHLAVVINDAQGEERFARVKVPHAPPRLVRVPAEDQAAEREISGLEGSSPAIFVRLEEVIAANLDVLFPGMEIASSHAFRITRDADIEIEEDEASDLIETVQEVVGQRHFGPPVRLEVDSRTPTGIRELLMHNLDLTPYQVYEVAGFMGLSDLKELTELDRPELKDPPFLPTVPPALAGEEDIFSVVRRRDLLLYHPYDSFNPVVDFIRLAAKDPDVVAIKQTLYRVDSNSPILFALREARENGKQGAALVELKARFDEENNIAYARNLEAAGVHVVYGLVGLKVHAKMALVVRREQEGVVRYVHVGTGHYNADTARVFTDLGYFTSDPELTGDVSDLFNAMTGYSRKNAYRRLLVSPHGLRDALLSRIRREIERHREHGNGRLAFKMNALVDKECIQSLYRASRAGVRVDLQVRGACCLRPGLEGVSDNITVTSIVGRFLEHSRIYYFHNNGDEELFVGSVDLMPRNLDGRVDLLVPIYEPRLLRIIRDDILFLHLRDNVQAHRLQPDGTYQRAAPRAGEATIDSQRLMVEGTRPWHLEEGPDS